MRQKPLKVLILFLILFNKILGQNTELDSLANILGDKVIENFIKNKEAIRNLCEIKEKTTISIYVLPFRNQKGEISHYQIF